MSIRAVVAVALVACGGSAPARSPVPEGANALFWHSCGPTDGSAVAMLVADRATDTLTCEDAGGRPKVAHTSIGFWRDQPPEEGRTYVVHANHSDGAASTCPANGECVPADEAKLVVDRIDANGFTGSLQVQPKGEPARTIPVRAISCVVPMVCG